MGTGGCTPIRSVERRGDRVLQPALEIDDILVQPPERTSMEDIGDRSDEHPRLEA
jgi:hypothetical protein